jgi:hypothetical protein
MTLEEEFDAIYECDPAGICDLLNASDINNKVIYRDPLYELYKGIQADAKNAHELLNKFNSTSEIELKINDIGNNLTNFLNYIAEGISNSNRFRDYCKIAFVKAMKSIKDKSIERCYDEKSSDYLGIKLGGVRMTTVPSYLKKYTTLTIPNLEFHNCFKLAFLDLSDCIDHRTLLIKNCNSLIGLKTITCNKIDVDSTSLTKIEVIDNPYGFGFGELDVIEIFVNKTAIHSLEDIAITPIKNCDYRLYIPPSITSFENPAYPDDMLIYYYLSQKTQISSLFGLKANQGIFLMMDTSGMPIYYILHDKTLIQAFLPNISNLPFKYRGYKQILEAHPELLTDKLMATIYKAYEPDSLAKFESLIKKVKSYNVDMDKIALLTSLLLK